MEKRNESFAGKPMQQALSFVVFEPTAFSIRDSPLFHSCFSFSIAFHFSLQLNMFNVESGDSILLPGNLKELDSVKIVWDGRDPSRIRKASYVVCFRYTCSRKSRYRRQHDEQGPMGHEVLVFIAAEMLADAYLSNRGHLYR